MEFVDIGLLIVCCFVFTIIIVAVNIKSEVTYTTEYNCSQIKDCILIEESCISVIYNNSLFGTSWSNNYKEAPLGEQNRYYKEHCLK